MNFPTVVVTAVFFLLPVVTPVNLSCLSCDVDMVGIKNSFYHHKHCNSLSKQSLEHTEMCL